MQTDIMGVPHRLVFRYDEAVRTKRGGEAEKRRTTAVSVMKMKIEGTPLSPPVWEEVAFAITICHPADTYRRAAGRNEAMERLMEGLREKGMPRELRAAIGSMYSGRVRGRRNISGLVAAANAQVRQLHAALVQDKLTTPTVLLAAEDAVDLLGELKRRAM
jgi:hypothetical protein